VKFWYYVLQTSPEVNAITKVERHYQVAQFRLEVRLIIGSTTDKRQANTATAVLQEPYRLDSHILAF
jgi:hypothetical protein